MKLRDPEKPATGLPHEMSKPQWNEPVRPDDYDGYEFSVVARCLRCKQTGAVTHRLPEALFRLIPERHYGEAWMLLEKNTVGELYTWIEHLAPDCPGPRS